MAKYAATLPLAFIHLDHSSSDPLYLQLYEQIRRAILTGQLPIGGRLPSTRDLATSLKISRNTVTAAFDQLFAEGYIEGKVGAGTYVAKRAFDHHLGDDTENAEAQPCLAAAKLNQLTSFPCNISKQAIKMLEMRDVILRHRQEPPRAFRLGLPALDMFPKDVWCRLTTQYWRYPQSNLLSYGDPCGYRPLREQIAAYLRQSRAVRCEPDQIIIVSGSQQALDIATRVLLDPGDTAWIEDPGYLGARTALLGAGANLVPVPVDQDGLNVEVGMARSPNAKLAYVTPSHQFPLGSSMSHERRLSLLEWAERSRAWILEDDYDSEYRYNGQPLTALQGLDDSGRVIYMGTFSKTLFPSLRLGYLVVPRELIDVFTAARAVIDRHSPLIEQAVLADFIAEGHFMRHIRRMRTLYAERQTALVASAKDFANLIDIQPCDTGMHLVGWLRQGISDRIVVQELYKHGITALPLSAYRLESSMEQGLMLGYAAVDSISIRTAMQSVGTVIQSLQPQEMHFESLQRTQFSSYFSLVISY